MAERQFETAEDIRRRMGGSGPVPVPLDMAPAEPRSWTSRILLLVRVVFGGMALLGFGMVVYGRLGPDYNPRMIGLGIWGIFIGVIVFGLTFVRRVF